MDPTKFTAFVEENTKIKRRDPQHFHLYKYQSQIRENCPDCGVEVENRVVYYYVKKKQWTKECQKCGIRGSVYIK